MRPPTPTASASRRRSWGAAPASTPWRRPASAASPEMPTLLRGGSLILPDRVEEGGLLVDAAGRIAAAGPAADKEAPRGAAEIDLDGRLVAPGYVDLHCHGGGGADFMDGTAAAFRTVLASSPAPRHHHRGSDDDSGPPRADPRGPAGLRPGRRRRRFRPLRRRHRRRQPRGGGPPLRPLLRPRGPGLPPGRSAAAAAAGGVRGVSRLRRVARGRRHRLRHRGPGTARRRGLRPRRPGAGHPAPRRPLQRHPGAGGGQPGLGRGPRGPPVLRHVGQDQAAPPGALADARRPARGGPAPRRAVHRGDRRRRPSRRRTPAPGVQDQGAGPPRPW